MAGEHRHGTGHERRGVIYRREESLVGLGMIQELVDSVLEHDRNPSSPALRVRFRIFGRGRTHELQRKGDVVDLTPRRVRVFTDNYMI